MCVYIKNLCVCVLRIYARQFMRVTVYVCACLLC